jgi:hypothetical protein
MKNVMSILIVVMSLLGFAGASSATVLTFDDIGEGSIVSGYGGLNWDNMMTLNGKTYVTQNSGYFNGTVSGSNVAFNAFANQAVVSNSQFDFNGAYFTAAWNNGLSIHIQGYDANFLKYDTTLTVDTTGPTYFNLGFLDIDKLVFNSFGGVSAGLGGVGEHFVMDNFTFNENVPVPEPSTLFLLCAGLFGLGFYGKRRMKA